jgi:hypothetical protein
VYDVLRACHEYDLNHAGIQATYKHVHARYAMIPRRVVNIYCNACRHCRGVHGGGGGGAMGAGAGSVGAGGRGRSASGAGSHGTGDGPDPALADPLLVRTQRSMRAHALLIT